jgi:hypothetical protein
MVPGPEDVIAQWNHQDLRRPLYRHFHSGEAPGVGSGPQGCSWPRGARLGTVELMLGRLIFCTPCAALGR